MPTTITAVIIFAVVLLPGLTFTHESERIRPSAKISVFRETSLVIAVSTVCLMGATVLLLFVSTINVEIGVSVDKYLRSPEALIIGRPRLALVLLLAYLIASSILAGISARKNWWEQLISKIGGPSHLLQESGWVFALTYKDDMTKFAPKSPTLTTVFLKDGTILRGQLFGKTVSANEDQQGSLTLAQPLTRTNTEGEISTIRRVERIVIHATEIQFVGFKTVELGE